VCDVDGGELGDDLGVRSQKFKMRKEERRGERSHHLKRK
jgi:hypothetical protein